MRLRNVKNATDLINASPYIINNPSIYKGQFKKLFNNNNPIKIEIGMGKGKFIKELALKNPNINYIGIEKFDNVLVRAIQKLDIDISNLKLIRLDAKELDKVFDQEIDTIYLNFSDPWPKKRHALRRLTSKTFLDKYNLICSKPNIIFKTDNRGLFEYSILSLNNEGYSIKNISLDLHKDNIKDNIETEYEIKFKALGPIYMLEATKD